MDAETSAPTARRASPKRLIAATRREYARALKLYAGHDWRTPPPDPERLRVIVGGIRIYGRAWSYGVIKLNDRFVSVPAAMPTIKHEIAHIIANNLFGPSGHNFRWRNVARSLGIDTSRVNHNGAHLYEGDNLLSPREKRTFRREPFAVVVCAGCGHIYQEFRSRGKMWRLTVDRYATGFKGRHFRCPNPQRVEQWVGYIGNVGPDYGKKVERNDPVSDIVYKELK